MTTAGKSARDGARVVAGTSRQKAAEQRRIERLLDARALGRKVDRIAYDLRVTKPYVARLIAARRAAGDPRALTDKQAVVRAEEVRASDARIAREVAVKASRPAVALVPPPPSPAPAEVASPTPPSAMSLGRWADVARVRELADIYQSLHPKAAAGFRHLADLQEHCATRYPNLPIPSEGASLESTRRMFPPSSVILSGGGPAAACLAG